MSTWEFNWYNKNVKQELGKFKSAADKLEFVFKEKEHFRTLFRSKDADVVLAMFDDLVESIKIKDQFPKPPANNKIFALSQKEISEILYDGLDYTPATRAQFYINKAIEMGYKPQSLLTELNSAYKTIKSYVFTPNTKEWEVNEVTGKRDNPKQTINLSVVTGGRQSGFITYKTIDKLFIPIFHQMQYLIQNTYNSKISPLINPTPPPMGFVQLINIIPSSLSTLPPIEKVFFIHYQCDKFEEGDHITSLCVYDNIDIKIFKNDEAKAIEAYCQKVDELSSKGLIPVHWDQNSPHFGIDHIKERYKILTGNDINLLYSGSLNLADYLKFKYGENYVPHRRLDNLARLNNFSGIYETENGNKTFPRDRILLLSKIYFNELKGNLKIHTDQNKEIPTNPDPTSEYEPLFEDDIQLNAKTSRKINDYLKSSSTLKDKLEINVEDFFDNIRESDITQIEIYNTVEKLTDNFKIEKLKILQKDFDFYFFLAREEKDAEFDENDIKEAIDDLQKKGKEIPFRFSHAFSKDANGKTVITPNANKYIDKQKLLYPFDFFGCYQFEALLNRLIKEQENKIDALEADQKTTPAIKESVNDYPKTKLIEYKDKLDFSLGYYSDLFMVINAIHLHDEYLLIESINLLKTKSFGVLYNQNLITEQVHFDLKTDEVTIFYNYGLLKIDQILDTYYQISTRIEYYFDDEVYNKKIHGIWHQYSTLGDIFVLYSNSHEGFIKDLVKSIENNIIQFKENFTSSISLNSNIKINKRSDVKKENEEKQKIQSNTHSPVIKPIFKPESIPSIFDILKGYFPPQHQQLLEVLETGIAPKEKLFFQGNGKTLLDFFKQLMKGQFLTIAVQKDFEDWVSNGFEYLHRKKRNAITPKYASKIISGNNRAAKGNRLIDVINKSGKFEILQLEIRNREQI